MKLSHAIQLTVIAGICTGIMFVSSCSYSVNRTNKAGITATELRCEYADNPIGVDTTQPRFSWILQSTQRNQMQSSYQVLVATAPGKLNKNIGDKWDSGKVVSESSVNIPYQGKNLTSGEKCFWKVCCWDKQGKMSDYSKPAVFEMGLLNKSDWQGKWISTAKDISSPLLRKEFTISKKIKKARVYISGLGWSELYINGKKIGDHVLDPATTYYNNDQSFELGSRVLYVTYDITKYLKTGRNAIGVMLGNGWYSDDGKSPGRDRFADTDRPQLFLQMNIEFAKGPALNIVSDETWKTTSGPITANEICLGEHYDARLEKTGWNKPGYDDSGWNNAVIADTPSGKLVSQTMPPVKVIKTIKPIKINKLADGVYIYDFGQHFSGWTQLRVKGPKGAKITIEHAGAVNPDGSLNTSNQLKAKQTDSYIVKGGGTELWEPRFTLHGFRYAKLTGFPGTPKLENLQGRFARNDVNTSGHFECSNPLLNQIHSNSCWTFMSSLQGIPQDAADRHERVAWLGDTGFVAEDYIYNYDTALFWAKWLNDIKDSQKQDGDIPVISPLHWTDPFAEWPCWKSTYPLIAWYLYQYYGDKRVLADHYQGIAKLVGFIGARAKNHIVPNGLGDHKEPDRKTGLSSKWPKRTPGPLTSTGYYYFDTWILAQTAKILGKTDDYKRYSTLAEQIKTALNEKFLNKQTNQYATGSQTSNAMALYLGLVPKQRQQAVLKNLVDDIMIKNQGHLSTGILGTNALEQVLGQLGRVDVMYEIATKTTFPSWGYTISKGATTIWESFEIDDDSLNMKMFGSTELFFYKDLAGIGHGAPGFRKINIKPCIVEDLTYARASLKTVRGLVSSSWEKTADSVTLKVTIPVNSEAKISVPKTGLKSVMITESAKPIWKNGKFLKRTSGITSGTETKDYVTFETGSGSYKFVLNGQK